MNRILNRYERYDLTINDSLFYDEPNNTDKVLTGDTVFIINDRECNERGEKPAIYKTLLFRSNVNYEYFKVYPRKDYNNGKFYQKEMDEVLRCDFNKLGSAPMLLTEKTYNFIKGREHIIGLCHE